MEDKFKNMEEVLREMDSMSEASKFLLKKDYSFNSKKNTTSTARDCRHSPDGYNYDSPELDSPFINCRCLKCGEYYIILKSTGSIVE